MGLHSSGWPPRSRPHRPPPRRSQILAIPWSSALFGKEIEVPVGELAIGRPQKLHGAEGGLVKHRAHFGEGDKTFVAVVVAHAAVTHAAKRQVVLANVEQTVV